MLSLGWMVGCSPSPVPPADAAVTVDTGDDTGDADTAEVDSETVGSSDGAVGPDDVDPWSDGAAAADAQEDGDGLVESDAHGPLDASSGDGGNGTDTCSAGRVGTGEHCEKEKWIEQLKSVPLPTAWTPIVKPGTPGYDKACRPAGDVCCATACDCKFVRVGDCKFASVSKAELWDAWGDYWLHKSTGKCWQTSCTSKTALSAAAVLDCIDGQCVASGPGTIPKL